MKRSLALAVCCLLAFAPAVAFAKKKTTTAAAAASSNSNGNGLGAGGVPALRDRLEADIANLQAQSLRLQWVSSAPFPGSSRLLAGQVARPGRRDRGARGAAIPTRTATGSRSTPSRTATTATRTCSPARPRSRNNGIDENCDGPTLARSARYRDRPREEGDVYRVIQWATGGVGRAAIEGILDHPELELVGCWVHGAAKDGRDVGEIWRARARWASRATRDVDALLALDADCVLYSPITRRTPSSWRACSSPGRTSSPRSAGSIRSAAPARPSSRRPAAKAA